MADFLSIIQLAIQYGPIVKRIIDEATSNDGLVAKLEAEAKPVGDLILAAGSALFPKAKPALQIVGGAIAAFDPNTTKWLQGALNVIMPHEGINLPPLVVDGRYGPKTKAAVEALQTELGLAVDGIAGNITQAAIQGLLTTLPKIG